jgi:hypothetical protein
MVAFTMSYCITREVRFFHAGQPKGKRKGGALGRILRFGAGHVISSSGTLKLQFTRTRFSERTTA